jgi:hypothetical protein
LRLVEHGGKVVQHVDMARRVGGEYRLASAAGVVAELGGGTARLVAGSNNACRDKRHAVPMHVCRQEGME